MPKCTIRASSPQQLSSTRLTLTVVAPVSKGCEADLSKVELLVANKVRFTLGKPQSRTLKPKEKWTLKLTYPSSVLKALRAARQQGKSVSARSYFKLDGKTATKTVALR